MTTGGPDAWKKANITPLFKKELRNHSLTSVPGKVMESTLLVTILRRVVGNSQREYNKRKSGLINLTDFYDEITVWIDMGGQWMLYTLI